MVTQLIGLQPLAAPGHRLGRDQWLVAREQDEQAPLGDLLSPVNEKDVQKCGRACPCRSDGA
jgi:hypothetical protein